MDLSNVIALCSQIGDLVGQIVDEIDQAAGPPAPTAAGPGRVITVVNKSTLASAEDFAQAVASVQQQLAGDFAQAWGLSTIALQPGPDTAGERIYVLDDSTQADALGFHGEDAGLVPVGYVFVRDSQAGGGDWAATLSHEALEQAIDPWCVGVEIGSFMGQVVGLADEVCDPVENDEYQLGGRQVSNFVLPEWFNGGFTGKVDQLGKLQGAGQLSAGGYVAFTADLQNWQQAFGQKTPPDQRQVLPYSRRARRWRRAVRKPAPAAKK